MYDTNNISIRAYSDKEDWIEGSTITHLEKLDPLSSDNLGRAKGAQDELPEDPLIQRTVLKKSTRRSAVN